MGGRAVCAAVLGDALRDIRSLIRWEVSKQSGKGAICWRSTDTTYCSMRWPSSAYERGHDLGAEVQCRPTPGGRHLGVRGDRDHLHAPTRVRVDRAAAGAVRGWRHRRRRSGRPHPVVPDPIEIDGVTARARFTSARPARSTLHHSNAIEAATPIWSEPESASGWPTPPRRGGRGPSCTRPTTGRGVSCCTVSGRILHGLTYFPNRRDLLAPTTSLPEVAVGRTQLGLPVLVGTRRQLHDRGALGGGVSRRGGRVLRVHDDVSGMLGRERRRPADHVRDRRRARSHRTRAACTCRGGGTVRPSGSATVRGRSASSTCTASCSTASIASPTRSPISRPRRRRSS